MSSAINPTLPATSGDLNGAVELVNRERHLELIRLYLDKGMCCEVVASPGLGKTTFLRYVAAHAREWNPAFKPAYLDLNDERCHTVEGFVAAAWEAWGESPSRGSLRVMSEVVEQWRARGLRPILLLDDFEEIASRPREFITDFYIDLRNIADSATMVTSSVQPLGQIIQQRNPVTSLFSNIFTTLYLGPF